MFGSLVESKKNPFKKQKMNLEVGEKINHTINHKNYIPLRQEDWARFIFIPLMIVGIYSFIKGKYFLILLTIPGILIIFNLIQRWIKIYKTKYYLTNKRLIIFDTSKNEIEHSLHFADFPKMTLRENAYNYGFIIIGEPEELIEGADTPFRFPIRGGLNLKDHEIVLDNIQNVRKIHDLIQEKINTTKKGL